MANLQANDLRYGNYVNASMDDYYPVKVTGISVDGIDYYYGIKKTGKAFSFIRPIQLTPEILEAAGFKRGGNKTYWFGAIDLIENNGGYELLGSEFKMGNTFYFVHQLQNLYFAIEQEELTIDLNQLQQA